VAIKEFEQGIIKDADGQLAIVKAEGADLEAQARKAESDIGADLMRVEGEVHGGGRGLLGWVGVAILIVVGLLIWAFR
jgi:hypothetical protein